MTVLNSAFRASNRNLLCISRFGIAAMENKSGGEHPASDFHIF